MMSFLPPCLIKGLGGRGGGGGGWFSSALAVLAFFFFAGSELWSAAFSQAGLRFLLVDPAHGIAFVLSFFTFDGPSCFSSLVLAFWAGFLLFASLSFFTLLFPEGSFFSGVFFPFPFFVSGSSCSKDSAPSYHAYLSQ